MKKTPCGYRSFHRAFLTNITILSMFSGKSIAKKLSKGDIWWETLQRWREGGATVPGLQKIPEKNCGDLDFPDFEFDVAFNTGASVLLTWD